MSDKASEVYFLWRSSDIPSGSRYETLWEYFFWMRFFWILLCKRVLWHYELLRASTLRCILMVKVIARKLCMLFLWHPIFNVEMFLTCPDGMIRSLLVADYHFRNFASRVKSVSMHDYQIIIIALRSAYCRCVAIQLIWL